MQPGDINEPGVPITPALPRAASAPRTALVIDRRLVQQLLDSANSTLIIGLMVGCVVYSTLSRTIGHEAIGYWLLALTVLTCVRLLLIPAQRRWLDADRPRAAGFLYTLLGFLGGILWAGLITYDDPANPVGVRLLLLITLVGMPIAGLSSNAIYKPAFYAFSTPIFAAMFYWSWWQSGLVLEFSALASAYVLFVIVVATRFNSTLRRNIVRELENERLLHEVSVMNGELQRMAYEDPLTGLSNRRSFEETAEELLLRLRDSETLVLMLIDMDDFKGINDSLGHAAGDRVLVTVSRRIGHNSRLREMVAQAKTGAARIGGDEFVVLYRLDFGASVEPLASRILEAATAPMQLGDREYRPRISIGIAMSPDHGTTLDALLRAADEAMYRAKNKGGQCYEIALTPDDRLRPARLMAEPG